MTRNVKVLLVASILVALWTTSSEACHERRRSCNQSYYQSGCNYGSPTGYYSSGQGGYVTNGGGYYGGQGIPPEQPAIPLGTGTASLPLGTTSAGPATIRAASAARRPDWGCGLAWASAALARGADRPLTP